MLLKFLRSDKKNSQSTAIKEHSYSDQREKVKQNNRQVIAKQESKFNKITLLYPEKQPTYFSCTGITLEQQQQQQPQNCSEEHQLIKRPNGLIMLPGPESFGLLDTDSSEPAFHRTYILHNYSEFQRNQISFLGS